MATVRGRLDPTVFHGDLILGIGPSNLLTVVEVNTGRVYEEVLRADADLDGIATTGAGEIYLVDSTTDTLYRLDLDTGTVTWIKNIGLDLRVGLARGPGQNDLYALTAGGALARIDLVTTFDAIHDQSRPAEVLAGIHRMLRPGGTYLCVEPKASSELASMASASLPPLFSVAG